MKSEEIVACMESCDMGMFAEVRDLSNLFYFLALWFLKLAVIVSFQNEVQRLFFFFYVCAAQTTWGI